MFNRLKIQLTLVNLSLSSLVLLLVFLGIFLFMKHGIELQSFGIMTRMAKEGRFRPGLPSPWFGIVQTNAFFIKTGLNGEIIELSPNIPFPSTQAGQLLDIARPINRRRGNLAFQGITYHFLKTAAFYGDIFVFLDTRPEKGALSWFIFASLIIGGSSLALVALVSLFLANRALVPIKQAWEKQRAFVADASHELRTPLAVIRTNLELIRENPEETVASQRKWLDNIAYGSDTMAKLVEDLLFLARQDTGERKIPVERFGLSEALQKVAVSFESIAINQGITFEAHIAPRVTILGNAGRITQLAGIFLDNAFKYTPSGGRVRLTLESTKNTAEITVSDTGEGIPGENLSNIFERFYRIDKSRSRNQGGAGLGLAIADCIVKEHGGKIQVSSEVGKGSVFRVILDAGK